MAHTNNQIQAFRKNSDLPVLRTAEEIAGVRLAPLRHPHYGSMPPEVRRAWLAEEIIKINMVKHIRPDKEMLSYDVTALDQYIMDDMVASDLTQAEIDRAFFLGIKGDYGDYYGLTADSLFGFLAGYIHSPEKREAARIVRIAKGIEKPESPGAVDYLLKVQEHNARVLKERMKQWQKEK